MSSDPLFGWDLTFKTVEKDIKRKPDIIIAFLHWNLIKRGFRCIGIGEERSLTGDEEKSELMPVGWNSGDNYTIRYVFEEKLFIFHGLITNDNMIVNLMRTDDLAVANMAFRVDDVVQSMSGTIDKMLPNYKELMHNVRRDLFDVVCNKQTTSSETQTKEPPPSQRRSADDPLRIPSRGIPAQRQIPPDATDPFSIGRSDLDPMGVGVGGSGMLFDPFGNRARPPFNPGFGVPGGLPQGAVPPGARFDPFAPPGVGGGPGSGRPRTTPPDADHLPPPGYDDMFI